MFKPVHNLLLAICLSSLASLATASEVTIPNSFSSGTPAVATEVNANFDAIKTAVDDNNSRIAALEATIIDMQAVIVTLQNELTSVQNNSVLALDGMLVSTTDANDYPTAQFTGVNVQVINGVDQTTINGLGNLIVGYNDIRALGSLVCSNGQYSDQPACEGAGETWARNHKSGSHNLVAGNRNSYSQTGGIIFGHQNAITRDYAGISGGAFNLASGLYSNVSGGLSNQASGENSSINGGSINIASGNTSSVNGGQSNEASNDGSSVNGGQANEASGSYSSVHGGRSNIASSDNSSVNGGQANEASGPYSTVGGGISNTASGIRSSVSGGSSRNATGPLDWVAGSLFEDL